MIKIMIVDDQKLFRESLKSILEQDADFLVAGCAENGLEAAQLCGELLPDIVLMDIKMPVFDGIEGAKMIKSRHPEIKVIMLTMIDEDQKVREALETLADGYILKDVTPGELKQLVKNVAGGFNIISKKVYGAILKERDRENEVAAAAGNGNAPRLELKENELEIVRHIADGKSNKEIAALLHLSEGRVKNIITEILDKLDVKDRYQLLSYAYKNNLVR